MIEVLPIKDSEDTAICVSNIEGNIITKNILISFYEDENGETKIDNSIAAAVTTNSVDPLYSASYGENTWRLFIVL